MKIMYKQISLVVADDHPMIRKAFANMFEDVDDIMIIGEASDGNELVTMVGDLRPDVVLTDIQMPVMNGFEATKIIRARYPEVAVLAASSYSENYIIMAMLSNGAIGYVTKNASKTEIISVIRAAAT